MTPLLKDLAKNDYRLTIEAFEIEPTGRRGISASSVTYIISSAFDPDETAPGLIVALEEGGLNYWLNSAGYELRDADKPAWAPAAERLADFLGANERIGALVEGGA